ncbi:hypothetical protein [Chryseobacterium sp. JV558]|uniref:hypothetical protein n=1 Tax=Chryseobacterium sp. JV558 TaxID=2663236 RepID=UPI00299F4453|nr:hypothetical protein [Chryseobacterium sp. JV558]MDW9381940.1 hypothetical protein [Chryseobacterium sp. JV558]
MEELQNLIKTSYGVVDLIFAGHEYDRKRALEAIKIANREGVGFNDFLDMHRDYLENKNCSYEHIENQILRVQQIGLYFSND